MFYWDQCKGKERSSKKRIIIEHVNENELVLTSSRVVLDVNERGIFFYITLRDLVEQKYKCSFHLQYKNQSDDSKN